jgi:hypothetical protein
MKKIGLVVGAIVLILESCAPFMRVNVDVPKEAAVEAAKAAVHEAIYGKPDTITVYADTCLKMP